MDPSRRKNRRVHSAQQLIGKMSRSPSYIIFLSDGWPTQGVTDSRQLINDISRDNAGKTAIFAYSGGSVNAIFWISSPTKNRGWSEYSEREQFIGKNLAAMYGKIRDPILLNLRYRSAALPMRTYFQKCFRTSFASRIHSLWNLWQ